MGTRARIADSDIDLASGERFNVYGARNIMYGPDRTLTTKQIRSYAKLFGYLYQAAVDNGMVMRQLNIRLSNLKRPDAYGQFQRGLEMQMTNPDGSEMEPRRYRDLIEIRVTERNLGEIISTFAHEMIHAEQHERGWLRTAGGKLMWDNVPVKMYKNMTYLEYINLPWEHDAFSRQHRVALFLIKKICGEGLITDVAAEVLIEQIEAAAQDFYSRYENTGSHFIYKLTSRRF